MQEEFPPFQKLNPNKIIMEKGHMKVAWYPNGRADKVSKIKDCSGCPFNLIVEDSSDKRTWKIHVFSGTIECTPYVEKEMTETRDATVHAAFTLYTPRNATSTLPEAKGFVDRRPTTVAHFGSTSMRLERGHAVTVAIGPGILNVSWDYPEFDQP